MWELQIHSEWSEVQVAPGICDWHLKWVQYRVTGPKPSGFVPTPGT